jgi:hypothetical protein
MTIQTPTTIVRATLQPPTERCAYCGRLAEGNYAIHRDGFCEGPEVPLCDACGGHEEPTCEAIWARIAKN